MSLMNAFRIHGNRIIPNDQFVYCIFLPIVIGVFGLLFSYTGLLLEAVPILGSFIRFVGTLWCGIAMLFFTYLGWLWFVSALYMFIISIWLIDTTNKFEADQADKFDYETEKFYEIDLGKSYTIKRFISLIAAIFLTASFDNILYYIVSILDFHGNDFSHRVWIPWKGLI